MSVVILLFVLSKFISAQQINNLGGIMNGGTGQQMPSFNAPMNGQQMNSSPMNGQRINGAQMNGAPMNGQPINTGSAFTFVKMSVFSSMNCQSMPINSTSIESGKCYTYADMCRLNKFSKQFCDTLPGNAKFSSLKFQCMGNGVQGNYFSDSKCTTSTSTPIIANSGACNQGIMYTCSTVEEQTVVNGIPNPSFLYNDALALNALASCFWSVFLLLLL